MEINKILKLAADAGKVVLENGGETYRVEETILRVCHAYNITLADSFVTPTGIIISVTDENGKIFTLVKRIHSRTVNLDKISKINDLSRKIKPMNLSIDHVISEIDKINNAKEYNNKILILSSAIGTAFFTLLFDGNIHDAIVSFFIGITIKSLSLTLQKVKLNDFFINVLGGAVTAFIALMSVHYNLADHIDKIIIGSIMLLVPGIAITNAIRDTIAGDLLAGISRAVEAFLIAIAIAVGTGFVLKIWFFI